MLLNLVLQDELQIDIQAPNMCPRYVGRVIRNIKLNVTTPAWIQEKLEKSDIRLIHPVVDILNYVMLEMGQPMHAFDMYKIKAPLQVRKSKEGEKIKLLDGQEATLKEATLVIADAQGVQAIAGIMGGLDSGVSETTRDFFLESALFNASLIAGKARLYGLHTDSSFRFERGVDPSLQVRAMERATQLICEICQGEPGPVIDIIQEQFVPKQPSIHLRYTRLCSILGSSIAQDKVKEILLSISASVSEKGDLDNIVWQVTPPTYRYDLSLEVDLIEEVARIVGYNNIPNTLPKMHAQLNQQSETTVTQSRVKRALVDLGFSEIISYSFVDGALQKLLFPDVEALALLNPISADMGEMRLSLWPGLLTAVKYNQNRQQQRMKLFEMGLCFHPNAQGKLDQIPMIGGLLCGDYLDENWGVTKRTGDFYDMKQCIEALWQLLGYKEPLEFMRVEFPPFQHAACHQGQCAHIFWQSKLIGTIGKLHPKIEKALSLDGAVYLFEVKAEIFQVKPFPKFARPSKFPEIRRDIAVIVDQSVKSDSLINFVRNSAGEICREVKIFDVYTGKGIDSGRKSIALGLILQHPSRTLVDKEVEDVIHTVVAGLKKDFSAELRD